MSDTRDLGPHPRREDPDRRHRIARRASRACAAAAVRDAARPAVQRMVRDARAAPRRTGRRRRRRHQTRGSQRRVDPDRRDARSGAVCVVRHASLSRQRTEDDPLHQRHRARLRAARQHAGARQPRADDSAGTRPAHRNLQSALTQRRRTTRDGSQAGAGVGAAEQGPQGHNRQQNTRQAHRQPARRHALRCADPDPSRGVRRRRDQRQRHSGNQQAEVRTARRRRRTALRVRHGVVRKRRRSDEPESLAATARARIAETRR